MRGSMLRFSWQLLWHGRTVRYRRTLSGFELLRRWHERRDTVPRWIFLPCRCGEPISVSPGDVRFDDGAGHRVVYGHVRRWVLRVLDGNDEQPMQRGLCGGPRRQLLRCREHQLHGSTLFDGVLLRGRHGSARGLRNGYVWVIDRAADSLVQRPVRGGTVWLDDWPNVQHVQRRLHMRQRLLLRRGEHVGWRSCVPRGLVLRGRCKRGSGMRSRFIWRDARLVIAGVHRPVRTGSVRKHDGPHC